MTDPLDDTKKYTYILFAENEGSNAIGVRETAALIVRCQPSEKALFINTPEYLASHENHRIKRWDGDITTNQWWTPASCGGAAFSQAPMTMLGHHGQALTSLFGLYEDLQQDADFCNLRS